MQSVYSPTPHQVLGPTSHVYTMEVGGGEGQQELRLDRLGPKRKPNTTLLLKDRSCMIIVPSMRKGSGLNF